MTKTVCDICGKDITNDEKRYIVSMSKSKPNEKVECKPSDWLMVKEVCMGCSLKIEQMFKS